MKIALLFAASSLLIPISTATAASQVPLARGVYVDVKDRCDRGHEYLYTKFDGRSVSYGAPSVAEVLQRQSELDYVAEYRTQDGKLQRDRFKITSPTTFLLITKFGQFYMRHCATSALPKEWRKWSEETN